MTFNNTTNEEKYFKVIAKCGHVGRRYYYPLSFYVIANDGKQAASIVREKPRVKHSHKDAILSVDTISREEYEEGVLELQNNPYNHCRTIQDQSLIMPFIQNEIVEETDKIHKFFKKYDKQDRRNRIKYKHKKLTQIMQSILQDANYHCQYSA